MSIYGNQKYSNETAAHRLTVMEEHVNSKLWQTV